MKDKDREDFLEFASQENIVENTIIFQIDSEDGSTREVLRVDEEGFKVYGELLKSADDVAAAFRHYFYKIGYGLDVDGKIIADEIQELESGKEQKDE